MRIFIAVRHAIDPQQFYGGLWSSNFYPALRSLGHDLVESQTDLQATSRFMDVASEFSKAEFEARAHSTTRILAEVQRARREGPVDLFLSYFYNAHFDPAGFDQLRAWGIPSINFYCNSIYQFPNVEQIAAKVDISWHAERDARERYLRAGARPIWVQMAADPDVYHPVEQAQRLPSACFVGQNYADRARWMAALIRADVPVVIYGPGWSAPKTATTGPQPSSPPREHLGRPQYRPGSPAAYWKVLSEILRQDGVMAGARRIAGRLMNRQARSQYASLFAPHARGPIPFQWIADVFAQHEVCLNFSNVWADGQPGSALIPHVRLRDFEGPMCRTCYLTGYTDEITEFYDLGKEIDTYRTPEELVEKARFYLTHADAAERLREAGFQRARRDHTWVRRFEDLFRKAGLPRH